MIYLASQSPRRKEILSELKLRHKIVLSRYQERAMKGVKAQELVLLHAAKKARMAVSTKKGLILAADTVVVSGTQILGKPRTKREAFEMLNMLQGRWHVVLTGLALWNQKTGFFVNVCDRSKVRIKKMSRKMILEYIDHANSLDKAGGYGIQVQPSIVTQIEGSYSNVMGLPKEVLKYILKVEEKTTALCNKLL